MNFCGKKSKLGKISESILMGLVWFGIICFFFPVFSKALDRSRTIKQFHHTAWTAKDGAPSQVSSLAQTTDGYLWIGSALGLFRFDGVTFEQYEPPDGTELPSHNTYALMATPDNGLWISFRPAGLGFLKDGKLQIFNRPEELPKSQVYCFARTPDGKIWAGTHNGLALFNGTGWDDIGADWNFQPNRVRTMFTDRDGTLWVSKDDAVMFLSPGANSFQELGKQTEYALGFAQSKDNRIWAANFVKSIMPINQTSGDTPKIKLQSSDLLFDRDGSLWLAGYPYGVRRIRFPEQLKSDVLEADDARVETIDESGGLSSDLTTNILEDREGNIWVGTHQGLDRFRYSSIIPVTMPQGNQRLTMAVVENGEIWSGNNYDSILHLSGRKIETKEFDTFKSAISSFYQAGGNDIWWGIRGGILHQLNNNFKFYPKPDNLTEDFIWEVFRGAGDGGLWVNYGDNGLVYFKDGVWENRPPPAGLPDRGPSASFEDEQKRIWLGYTENRVFILDGERVQGYSNADGIEIGRVKVIRGRNGNYFVGGELGLAFYKDGRFYTVKTDGKPFDAISGIVPTENGDVWLNAAHGIVNIPASEIRQLNENPEHAVRYRLYDFEDNLPGGSQMNFTVSTAIESTDKRLWFATDKGLALIDPLHLEKNNVPPPVLIKSTIADEKTYEAADTKFPAGTANLQINYTATSLSIPERVIFKYRLDGYEDQWRDAGSRRAAFYTNLAPGKYRFQVIAANNDGIWNEEGAILEFEILPMFYQTNWFFLLCLAAFAILVWVGYQWRVRQVKVRLDLIYEERLAERTRIARDLHDTLLQGIVSVSMQLESVIKKLPPDAPAKSRLERMREMTRQIITEGRHTVNGLRSFSKVDANDLEQEISRIGQQLNAQEKVNFHVTVEGTKKPLCPPIHEEVYHICREALSNAFRHSEASLIEVEIQYSKNLFRIQVRDDGIGIDEKILKTGRKGHWGISGMKERAERIGSVLKINSRNAAGTEIELTIPHRVAFQTENFKLKTNWLDKIFHKKNSAGDFERKGKSESEDKE